MEEYIGTVIKVGGILIRKHHGPIRDLVHSQGYTGH